MYPYLKAPVHMPPCMIIHESGGIERASLEYSFHYKINQKKKKKTLCHLTHNTHENTNLYFTITETDSQTNIIIIITWQTDKPRYLLQSAIKDLKHCQVACLIALLDSIEQYTFHRQVAHHVCMLPRHVST